MARLHEKVFWGHCREMHMGSSAFHSSEYFKNRSQEFSIIMLEPKAILPLMLTSISPRDLHQHQGRTGLCWFPPPRPCPQQNPPVVHVCPSCRGPGSAPPVIPHHPSIYCKGHKTTDQPRVGRGRQGSQTQSVTLLSPRWALRQGKSFQSV